MDISVFDRFRQEENLHQFLVGKSTDQISYLELLKLKMIELNEKGEEFWFHYFNAIFKLLNDNSKSINSESARLDLEMAMNQGNAMAYERLARTYLKQSISTEVFYFEKCKNLLLKAKDIITQDINKPNPIYFKEEIEQIEISYYELVLFNDSRFSNEEVTMGVEYLTLLCESRDCCRSNIILGEFYEEKFYQFEQDLIYMERAVYYFNKAYLIDWENNNLRNRYLETSLEYLKRKYSDSQDEYYENDGEDECLDTLYRYLKILAYLENHLEDINRNVLHHTLTKTQKFEYNFELINELKDLEGNILGEILQVLLHEIKKCKKSNINYKQLFSFNFDNYINKIAQQTFRYIKSINDQIDHGDKKDLEIKLLAVLEIMGQYKDVSEIIPQDCNLDEYSLLIIDVIDYMNALQNEELFDLYKAESLLQSLRIRQKWAPIMEVNHSKNEFGKRSKKSTQKVTFEDDIGVFSFKKNRKEITRHEKIIQWKVSVLKVLLKIIKSETSLKNKLKESHYFNNQLSLILMDYFLPHLQTGQIRYLYKLEKFMSFFVETLKLKNQISLKDQECLRIIDKLLESLFLKFKHLSRKQNYEKAVALYINMKCLTSLEFVKDSYQEINY